MAASGSATSSTGRRRQVDRRIVDRDQQAGREQQGVPGQEEPDQQAALGEDDDRSARPGRSCPAGASARSGWPATGGPAHGSWQQSLRTGAANHGVGSAGHHPQLSHSRVTPDAFRGRSFHDTPTALETRAAKCSQVRRLSRSASRSGARPGVRCAAASHRGCACIQSQVSSQGVADRPAGQPRRLGRGGVVANSARRLGGRNPQRHLGPALDPGLDQELRRPPSGTRRPSR